MSRLGILALLLFTLIACKEDEKETQPGTNPPPEQSNCRVGIPHQVRLKTTHGSQQDVNFDVFIKDKKEAVIIASTYDNCGTKISDIKPTWSLLTSNLALLTETVEGSAKLTFHRGASQLTNPILLVANYNDMEAQVRLHVSWTISDTPELYRWYRADSLVLNQGDKVGVANQSALIDLAGRADAFDGVSARGREPVFTTTDFSSPMIRFCGPKCDGVLPSLRLAPSHTFFKGSDLTLFFAVARNSEAPTFLLGGHLNSNHSGLFVGWVSNTVFRASLSGPNEKPVVDYTVEPFTGVPSIDIWTVKFGHTTASEENRGLRLYLNGEEVASNPEALAEDANGLKTIPYLGSEREENKKSDFYLGEFLVYKKALSNEEIQKVSQFLKEKYL